MLFATETLQHSKKTPLKKGTLNKDVGMKEI